MVVSALVTAVACGRGADEDPVGAALRSTGEIGSEQTTYAGPQIYTYDVVNTYPHDTASYTQGLEFVDGLLLESTGQLGRSTIRLVDPVTGTPATNVDLPPSLFGEGATVVGGEVWQLTYTSETALVRDIDDLTEIRQLSYDGEGWGLCHDGSRLVMSNGSAELTFRDPVDFAEIGRVTVTVGDGPVENLNELECVNGSIWANIYQTNWIIEVDPETGRVIGIVDLGPLVPDGFAGDDDLVLNGIAHHPETGRFWVTGKQWPVMYELDLEPGS